MDQYNDQHPAAATVPRVTAAPATTATRWPCPTKAAPVAPAEHEEADDDAPATDTWSDHASDPDAAHAPVISPQPAVDPQPPATLLSDMADDHSPPRDMDLFHDPNLFDQYMYASKDDTDQNPAAANVLLTTAAPAEQEELLLPMTPTTPEREKVNEDMEHDFFFNSVWAVPPSPVAPAEQEALAPDVQAQPEVKQEHNTLEKVFPAVVKIEEVVKVDNVGVLRTLKVDTETSTNTYASVDSSLTPEPEVLAPDALAMEQGHSGLPPFSDHLLDDFKTTAPAAPGDAASGSSTYSSLRGAPQHEPPAAEEVAYAPAPKRRMVAKNHDPHACTWSECGKSFKSASALTQHVRVHTKEQPFACDWAECGKRFDQKINLKTHVDSVHLLLTHRCVTCDHGFTNSSNLSNHLKWVVACGGEKKFHCEVCTAAFGKNADLNRHKKSNTHQKKVAEASKTHKRKAGEAFPSDE